MDAASRDGYGAALLDLAENDKIVVLEADLGKSTKSCLFRAEYPQRAFSMGIAEQNMMLVAAGLASTGMIPFASTFAISRTLARMSPAWRFRRMAINC